MSAASEDRLVRSRQPRQLLLALLGEFVIDGDPRPIPASAFIEVLDAAGIAAPATRATLDRVEQRGLIARERRGREIVFSPTPTGVAVLREATERVRDPHPFHAPMGVWTFVTFSLPEDLRSLRSRLRSTLTWEGFAPLRDGLWVAPGEIDLERGARSDARRSAVGRDPRVPRPGTAGFPMADSARAAWDIEAIRAEHLAFIDTWSTPTEESPSALVTRTMLVADWLALLRADPRLPRELLDDDWPADRSLALYRRAARADGRACGGRVRRARRAPAASADRGILNRSRDRRSKAGCAHRCAARLRLRLRTTRSALAAAVSYESPRRGPSTHRKLAADFRVAGWCTARSRDTRTGGGSRVGDQSAGISVFAGFTDPTSSGALPCSTHAMSADNARCWSVAGPPATCPMPGIS